MIDWILVAVFGVKTVMVIGFIVGLLLVAALIYALSHGRGPTSWN